MAVPASELARAFRERFGRAPALFRAPGRVNLIGEHTDYTGGFVLPIAIDLACYSASAPNGTERLRVWSRNLGEQGEWPIAEIPQLRPEHKWTDYVIGVVRQIPQPSGRDILIDSTVPLGSGLSSSAALEVAVALAAGWDIDAAPRIELAKLCRRAENDFMGFPSGIMDQYVAVFGEPGAAVKIDCRSLEHEIVPLPPGVAVVAVNSMVKHELGQSAYRDRVAECARAAAAMHHGLRDATIGDLRLVEDAVARKRARHVITENQRVLDFVEASRRDDLEALGRLLVESHRSLQHDYEVSCAEIDFLVETALAVPGVYGARITGGGFGGCTVNLLRPGAVEEFKRRLAGAYEPRFGKRPEFYELRLAAGAERILENS